MLALPVLAQKTKTVEGEYIYRAPENVTLEQAKQKALQGARIQALANEFGTTVAQHVSIRMKNASGLSETDASSLAESEVKGEWLEDIGTPTYSTPFYEGNMLVIGCKVKGLAREIITAAIDLKAYVLRNGTEDRFESDQFRAGDDLYLSFTSPVAGYLTVYLVDDDGQAFCLLPYGHQEGGNYQIEANKRYLFFNRKAAPADEREVVDEYSMTCNGDGESDLIYMVFSPTQFYKATDKFSAENLPRQLSYTDFNKWLVTHRRKDAGMNVIKRQILVTPKK